MITSLIQTLGGWVVAVISTLGYPGIFLCMTIEGACIPLPSEVILTFSGFLVSTGRFDFALAALAGALGNLFGSSIMYYVALKGGRPFFEKYGKFLLISRSDLDFGERWFQKYGDPAIFLGQLLPVVRTYINLPAGILKMKYVAFAIYDLLGAIVWSVFLVFIGYKFGQNWKDIEIYFSKFNTLITILVVAAIVFFIYHQVKKFREIQQEL